MDKRDRDLDREIGCNREEITTTLSSIGIIRMIKTVVESTITTTVIKTAEKIVEIEIEIEIEEAEAEANLNHNHNQGIGRGESHHHHLHHRGHRLHHPHHHQGRRRLCRGCRCRIRP